MVIELPPNLPVGFRFHPTDVELLTSYLKPKIFGKSYDVDAIAEVDFCELEPWELPGKSKIATNDRLWWFLCRPKYKNQSSRRLTRKTKSGFWKITGQERMIKDEITKRCVGRKRTLVFHTGSTPGKRTNWVMQEIYLDPDTFTIPPNIDSYVICRLKRKSDENVETPGVEVVPNLERPVSPPSFQLGNFETQMDPGMYSELPIESQLTEEDIRWMLSDEQQSPSVAADSSDGSPEDFVNGLLLDDIAYDTITLNDPNFHMSLKRSNFGDALDESDNDAEGANAQYFQTGESSGYFFPNNVSSKKVRQMRMSKSQSETLKTSVASQHFMEEQTVIPGSDSLSRKESSSHSMACKPVELGIFSVSLPKPDVIPAVVTGGNRQKRIQILKSDSLSFSSSSASPVTKSAIKVKEPPTYVLQSGTCVKENRDNRKVVEKGSVETRLRFAVNESPTSNWSSVINFVDTSSLSIHRCNLSLMEHWLNVIVGSVLFLVFVRELVVFGSW